MDPLGRWVSSPAPGVRSRSSLIQRRDRVWVYLPCPAETHAAL